MKKKIGRSFDLIRVKNEDVAKYLGQGYFFCSKSEWKKKVRDKVKKEVKSLVDKKETNQESFAD